MLKDPSPETRRSAASAISQIRDDSNSSPTIKTALNQLLNDSDPSVRLSAWDSLVNMRLLTLEQAQKLSVDQDPLIRQIAARSLWFLGNDSFDVFKTLIADDQPPSVRSDAISCAAVFGRKALPYLLKAVEKNELDYRFSTNLAQISFLQEIDPELIIPLSAQIFRKKSADTGIKTALLNRLIKYGDKSEAILKEVFVNAADNNEKVQIMSYLSFWNGSKKNDIVTTALRDKAPEVRQAALIVLVGCGSDGQSLFMKTLQGEQSSKVKAYVTERIAYNADQNITKQVINQLLLDKDPLVVEAAQKTLDKMN